LKRLQFVDTAGATFFACCLSKKNLLLLAKNEALEQTEIRLDFFATS
jgi:hypothetical protein